MAFYGSSFPSTDHLPHHDFSYYSYYYAAAKSPRDQLSHVTYTTSYSTSVTGFDDSDYEEYDPTPYAGGYDQAKTYGSPVPPSEATCYPRTPPQISLESFSDDGIVNKTPVVEQGGEYRGVGYFYGSGLESVDLCESLFGYWPCLAKREEEEKESREEGGEGMEDPWGVCAEYLFGGGTPIQDSGLLQ